jgi:hypothetical protein
MGQHGGVRITTEGLRNLYDFSNTNSYAGAASTSYDLISNLHHILSSVTSSGSGSSRALSFAGTGYSTYSLSNMGLSGGYARTVSCWVKFSSTSNQVVLGQGTNLILTAAELVMHNGVYKLHSGIGQLISSGIGISDTSKWYFLTSAYESGIGCELYVNAGTGVTLAAVPLTTDTPLRLGVSCLPATFPNLSGQIAIVQFYTRRLTPKEIQKIYDSTKKRFGL